MKVGPQFEIMAVAMCLCNDNMHSMATGDSGLQSNVFEFRELRYGVPQDYDAVAASSLVTI